MKKILFAALLLLYSCSAWAAPQKISRPATKEDLVGLWQMVSVRPVPQQKDPVFFPYQRFSFQPDSSVKIMVADKPFTKEWEDKFQRTPAAIDYSLNEKGLLTLTWQKQPHSEQAVCAYVLQDIPAEIAAKLSPEQRKGLPKKGDVTLSFLNGAGKIAYQKVLTKLV